MAFFRGARQIFPALGILWLLASLRVRRPWFLMLGVLGVVGYVFCVTNYPLRSLYGLLTSGDRVGNLELVQVVASGNPPLETAQAGQLHFEPFWGLLVALLSGFNPDRVLALYPFLPLATSLGFASSLYWTWRLAAREQSPDGAGAAVDPDGPAWEGILIAGFGLLLSSAPFEYAGTYRVPWAMTFMLKPNHALGFALLPWVILTFSRIRRFRGRIGVGFLLHLLGWVFVIHMGIAVIGLALFAAWSLLTRHADRRKDVLDAAIVVGVNVLIVSPYLVMLLVGYPFLEPGSRAMIPSFSAHLLEASVKQGAVFWLGLWGVVVAARWRGRMGRVFAGQVAAGYAVWAAMLVLSLLHLARERDEIYYWIRFMTAAAAGLGAADAAARACAARALRVSAGQRCAAVLALALPWSLPYWWDPLSMDSYIAGSLDSVPERLGIPTDFIRRSTPPAAVFAGDRDYARYVSALGARRVSLAVNLLFPKRGGERVELERSLLFDAVGETATRLARQQDVSYFVVTPHLLTLYASAAEQLPPEHPHRRVPRLPEIEARPHLERAFLWRGADKDFVAIFRIRQPRP